MQKQEEFRKQLEKIQEELIKVCNLVHTLVLTCHQLH